MAIQLCPRCGSGAPEGAPECKICGSPMGSGSAAATAAAAAAATPAPVAGLAGIAATPETQPNYLSGGGGMGGGGGGGMGGGGGGGMDGGGGGDVRVSLTGEVMEVPKPSVRGTGPGGYGPPPGAGPAGGKGGKAGPAGAPRPRGAGLAYEEEKKKSSPVGMILLVILVLAGAAGGYWWYNNRTNPKDQALLVYKSLVKRDWKNAVDVMAFNGSVDKDAFVKGADDGYNRSAAMMPPGAQEALDSMEITVGEPALSGGKADVPTIGKLTLAGRSITLKGVAHMTKQGGAWKLDLTTTKPDDQTGVQKALAEMIGRPDTIDAGGPIGGGMPGKK